MPGDVLIALAQFAGQTVASAAVTDAWEAVRGRFARRRPEVASEPVRLVPRPVFLAGREWLLAELDARLAGKPGQSGPRQVALCGRGARAAPNTGTL